MHKSFGELLYQKRNEYKLSLREAAAKIGISAMYLSDLENSKKTNPSIEIIYKFIKIFSMNETEIIELFELHGKENNIVCLDLPDYIMSDNIIRQALREAKKKPATSEDWKNFMLILKNKADI